jgi:TPR repeat protein
MKTKIHTRNLTKTKTNSRSRSKKSLLFKTDDNAIKELTNQIESSITPMSFYYHNDFLESKRKTKTTPNLIIERYNPKTSKLKTEKVKIAPENNFKSLDEIEKKYRIIFDNNDRLNEKLILNIYNNKFEKNFNYDGYTLNTIASYYQDIKNYDLAEKYYLKAIEKGSSDAMTYLGYHYYKIKNNFTLAKKYYLMSIKKGNIDPIVYLGKYYEDKSKLNDIKPSVINYKAKDNTKQDNTKEEDNTKEDNIKLMKKYYLMAIKKGHPMAMSYLGHYYETVELNQDLAVKYYKMAVEHFNRTDYKFDYKRFASSRYHYIINYLGDYYEKIGDYKLMKKYYLMHTDNAYAMKSLALYYQNIEKNNDLMMKYYIKTVNNGYYKESDILEKVINYYKENKNYKAIKKIYLEIIKSNSIPLQYRHQNTYICAMYKLGDYYKDIEKNPNLMNKYYTMAKQNLSAIKNNPSLYNKKDNLDTLKFDNQDAVKIDKLDTIKLYNKDVVKCTI